MDVTEFLRSHPLFEGLSAEALGPVAEGARARRYAAGEAIIHGGERGVFFGIIRAGRAEAVARSPEGVPRAVGLLEEGDCFGEISLLTGESSGVDVLALGEVEAILLPEDALSQAIAANPRSVKYLSRLLGRRLRASQRLQAPAAAEHPAYAFGAAAPLRILVVNCGSSSLKYCCYDTSSEEPLARGIIENLGTPRARHLYRGPGGKDIAADLPGADISGAFQAAAAALTDARSGVLKSLDELNVVGHRVAHGGDDLDAPAPVTEEVKEKIRRLARLAPLHNPANLAGIEECERRLPHARQVAVFDTAFHQRMPTAAHAYAIPRDLAQREGLRRYGFHGTSHEFVGRRAAQHLGRAFGELKLITCHLGNGASMAAIEHGRSIDTSMGLTPLEGLVMGTRCGDVDPAIVIHLLTEGGMAVAEVDDLLNRRSGLLGLSGFTHDMRELEKAADEGNHDAVVAIRVFCYRAKKYLGAYLAALGGADAIVFTGGIGECSAGARARICQGLSSMGIILDEGANQRARVRAGDCVEISDRESRVRLLVVGTDEERMIARQAVQALRRAGVTRVLTKKKDLSIPLAVSAHHVHLTREHVETLFGAGHALTPAAELSQPGQYACEERIALVGPTARIERVRVLGPCRGRTQVEISRTEEFKLGIDAPIRASGDLDGSPGLHLEGPAGSVTIEEGVINALRHIHMSPEDALALALRDRDIVRVHVEGGPRSLTFGDVLVRVRPDFKLEMHLDTDEANAAEIRPGAVCHLDSIQERPQAGE